MSQLILSLVLIALFILFTSSAYGSSQPSIFTSDSNPHGKPFSEWIAKWWQWWLGIPNNKHIVQKTSDGDITYEQNSSVDQDGPVWFLPDVLQELPGSHLEYSCDIPKGKDILIPITTTECDSGSEGGTPADIKVCANNIRDFNNSRRPTRINIQVDGKPIKHDQLLRGSTEDFFKVTIPPNPTAMYGDNVYPPSGGTFDAMASGYFLFLKEPSSGNHEITFECEDQFDRAALFPASIRKGKFNINVV